MTHRPVNPFVIKDVDFTVAADDFSAHVNSVRLIPTTQTRTWKGFSPEASFSEQTAPEWSCTVKLAQDWDNANSLANYLLDNAGEEVAVTFKPRRSGTSAFTVTLILTPPEVGGDIDSWAEATVSLGVKGAPVKAS